MSQPNSSLSIATFMIICPTSFFLGILFSLFPYDYPLLWSRNPLTPEHLTNVETHLKLLYNSPNLISRILHIVSGMGIFGLVIKLYKPSESNMLFDGGSLVLYMIALVIYLTNIIKGLRIVDVGAYGVLNLNQMTQDQLDDVDSAGNDAETGGSVLGREDNLKVLAASNTITALVLVGVIVLQVGQWYAERVDQRERKKAEEEHLQRQREALQAAAAQGGAGAGGTTATTTTGAATSPAGDTEQPANRRRGAGTRR